jgi:hypothetical protein
MWVNAKNSLKFTLDTISTEEKSIIFINSKNEKGDLGIIKQGLIEKGFTEESIMIYNSLQKDAAEELIATNNVPEHIKVIITTSVIVEGFNINTDIDKMFIISAIHPLMMQQLANRTRNAAIKMIYMFVHQAQPGTEELDLRLELRLNSLNSEYAGLAAKRGSEFAKNILADYLKINNITTFMFDDMTNRYKINHLSVDFLYYEEAAKLFNTEFEFVDAILYNYNWVITEDASSTTFTKAEKNTLLEKAESSTAEAIDNLVKEVQTDVFTGEIVSGNELAGLKQLISKEGFTVKRNLMEKLIKLMSEYSISFEKSVSLVKTTGISEGSFQKVVRMCDIQVMKNKPVSEKSLTVHEIYSKLEVGKTYNTFELCKIANSLNKSKLGRAMQIKDFTFRTIMSFIEDFVTLERRTRRVEGKRVSVYEVVNLNPLNI